MRALSIIAAAVVAALVLPPALRPASADERTPPALASDPARRPFPMISVSGTSELAIAPDEAWVHLGVESFLPTMESAVQDNDRRIAAILVALRQAGIDAADLSTTTMTLAETDRYEDASKKVHGWQVSRSLVARVRQLDTLEKLLQTVVRAGATHLRDVRFAHSQLADKKVDARAAAMKAARDKAVAMADALGQKVGRAVGIREVDAGHESSGFSDYLNSVVNAGGVPLEGQTIAAGRIRVEVVVAVDFELL